MPEDKVHNEVLKSLGLSQEKIDYILRTSENNKSSKAYGVAGFFYLVLMAIFTVGYIFIARIIFFEHLMENRIQGGEYFFYDSIWMSHLFPMMFLGILFPGWFLYKFYDYFPKSSLLIALKPLHDIARDINDDYGKEIVMSMWRFNLWYVSKLIDKDFHAMSIEKGLRYLNHKSQKWMGICMLPLIALALPLMILDASNFKLAGKEGVLERRYASFQTIKKSWNDVTNIETGCYYFDGNDKKLSLKYTMFFNDGSEFDLFEASSKEDKITQIQTIDNILRQLEKPFSIMLFKGGIHKGNVFVNNECFLELRSRYPDRYNEVLKLLRLEKFTAAK